MESSLLLMSPCLIAVITHPKGTGGTLRTRRREKRPSPSLRRKRNRVHCFRGTGLTHSFWTSGPSFHQHFTSRSPVRSRFQLRWRRSLNPRQKLWNKRKENQPQSPPPRLHQANRLQRREHGYSDALWEKKEQRNMKSCNTNWKKSSGVFLFLFRSAHLISLQAAKNELAQKGSVSCLSQCQDYFYTVTLVLYTW